MKSTLKFFILVCGVTTLATTVQAQFSIYRDTNSFFSALNSANFYTQNFGNLVPNTTTDNPLSYSSGVYQFQVNIPGETLVSVESYGGKIAVATMVAAQSISLTNLNTPIRAIGGYFYPTDGAIVNDLIDINIIYNSGSLFTVSTNVPSTDIASYFFGFVATNPATIINSLTVDTPDDQSFATLSEVTISTVPEPSTYALLSLATAGLALHLIRRRRA